MFLIGVLLLAGGLYTAIQLGFVRYEMTGGALIPSFQVGSEDAHYERIERARAEQAKSAPPAPVETAAAAAPVANAAPVATAAAASYPAPYWFDYRGPGRDGVYSETPILTQWPAGGLAQVWRTPVGGGHASMTVANGKVFTIEQRRNQEVVAAYDLATGRELWANSWNARFSESMGGDGPRATPVWNSGRVYALGGAGDLYAIDAANGKTVWFRNVLTDAGAPNLQWGTSATPLILEDRVIAVSGRSVLAYAKGDGAILWKSQEDGGAYAAPVPATLAGVRQVVATMAKRVIGVNPADGKLLWEFPWVTEYDVNSAEPLLVSENRFVISSGYDHGAALVEVARGGSGLEAKQIWFSKAMKAKFNAPVFHQGHVYGLDEGILACMDAETGKRKWKGGRYGYGQVLLASGHLVIVTEDGRVALVKATPESHQEVASFQALDGKTWNNPALAHGKLLVRNQTELACYRIAP
ncbi:MAG: PQQ-like beta-propeller repeat protein [Bryobacteraceae bacterium]|nr:PQQ-like beta-propeller repeat protein [Bryobacteraceae bacterium]